MLCFAFKEEINQIVFISRERCQMSEFRGFKQVMKDKAGGVRWRNTHNTTACFTFKALFSDLLHQTQHFACLINSDNWELLKEAYFADWNIGSGFGRGFGASHSCSVRLRALQGEEIIDISSQLWLSVREGIRSAQLWAQLHQSMRIW